MTQAQWSVDHVELDSDSIEIHGWALPFGVSRQDVIFCLNDREFDVTDYSLPRDDIARIFSYLPEAGSTGFRCRSRIGLDELFAKGFAEFRFAARRGPLRTLSSCSSYYPDSRVDSLPLPDGDRRRRVHGSDAASSFRIEGASTFVKLQRALGTSLGRDFSDFSSILDWGCGCGRSTRHFARLRAGRVTGVDIDEDNIEWCRSHLPFARFHVVPLHPPTPLSPASFDLLIGISVFTHLREREQFEWLAELQRISAPGAVLLMTIHADAAVCRSALSRLQFDELMTRGFLDAGWNPGLEDAIAEPDYYRNTFQRVTYVRERWSEYFEILDILPGYIGCFQDLVILRRR
jgi:SAM-dependent methyltransferase